MTHATADTATTDAVTADHYADDEEVVMSGRILKELTRRAEESHGKATLLNDAAALHDNPRAWMATLTDDALNRTYTQLNALTAVAWGEVTRRARAG